MYEVMGVKGEAAADSARSGQLTRSVHALLVRTTHNPQHHKSLPQSPGGKRAAIAAAT
jgi:hypothetical protein